MGKIFSARVRFLSAAEGGRLEPAQDGIRPQLDLGHVRTSCVVRSATGARVFNADQTYDLELEIVFWDQYGHLFDPDAPIRLFDGSRLIAVGEFAR